MINWGEAIAVNGVRPLWLRAGDLIQWAGEYKVEWLPKEGRSSILYCQIDYDINIRFIRLPADHWAYEPIRRGFTPWAGDVDGKKPEDWDKGPVLYSCGVVQGGGGDAKDWRAVDWRHLGFSTDIIGYKPRPAAATEEMPQWALDKAEQVLDCVVHNHYVTEAVARYIMQHEEAPVTVDPDVQAVREILASWRGEDIADVEDDPNFGSALAVYRKWKDHGHD